MMQQAENLQKNGLATRCGITALKNREGRGHAEKIVTEMPTEVQVATRQA